MRRPDPWEDWDAADVYPLDPPDSVVLEDYEARTDTDWPHDVEARDG